MFKHFIFLMILLPIDCFAQFTISGKVLNGADKRPVENANVFLSNATIGDKTVIDGTFTLHNVKPGKYDLVVSNIAFESYNQAVIVGSNNIVLPDITLFTKTIGLKEVTIKFYADPHREKYYNWFKDEFLGTSALAKECKILNPNVLDLSYDETANALKASSYDFLEIENDALGYKIKFLLTDFLLQNNEKKIYYKGPVLFEELKGNAVEERRWKRTRQEVYENSPLHFLRSALSNRIDEEGFRVQQLAIYANPERPADSIINARIKFYKDIKSHNAEQRDSLSYWVKKSRLQKTFQKLMPYHLNKKDIIMPTDQPGQYALGCDNDGLFVAYSKSHHFHISDQFKYLYNPGNTENTLIMFNSPYASFYSNGVLSNPYSLVYYGVWGRNRLAELLPIDYEAPQAIDMANTAAESMTTKPDTFLSARAIEKAYLHFDKPYYATGDTIYFKAYVTMGERHDLSQLSGILHVDLINTANKIDQSIKLQLVNGLAWGDFTLPDTLPKGNYRIRAYTQWMRNDGNYFEQVIPVGSVHNRKVPESNRTKAIIAKPEIQFFPEGGNLVTGIRSKIAFKAMAGNGLAMEAKGSVIDNTGKIVTQFTSAHLGMGYFYLEPEEGKTYTANIIFADGTQSMIALPVPDAKGIVLTVNNDSIPGASVRIQANAASYHDNRGKDYTLLIYSGGMVTTVTCKLDSPVICLDIIKRRLHTGIARVTLFSPAGEPLSERLLFIQNYDQLNLDINSDKTTYASREKISIKLNAKTRADSAVIGHFSVSVIDESKVPVDENTETTILTNLLLTSDLKGFVEQPNYYFTDVTDEKLKNLDLVMLTHGYRRFEWKRVLNDNYPPLAYQPETDLEITGTAKNLFGNPLAKAAVSLISTQSKQFISTVADGKGNFRFKNLLFTDSAKFILQAVNAKGKQYTKLTYNKDIPMPVNFLQASLQVDDANPVIPATYLENNEKQQEELNKLGFGKGRILKEVKIKSIKLNDKYETQSLAGAGHADQVVHSEDVKYGSTLAFALDGKLHGIGFSNPSDPQGGVPFIRGMGAYGRPMLIIVDGVQLQSSDNKTPPGVNAINPNDVETVEVLKGASASIYGMQGGDGVLIITTKRGGGADPKDIASVGILPIAVQGYYKARGFYSPKYESNLTNIRHDLRSTIYWKPELITDQDGNASFEYFNASGTGTYKVIIEGIDEKGNLGRRVYRYKVD